VKIDENSALMSFVLTGGESFHRLNPFENPPSNQNHDATLRRQLVNFLPNPLYGGGIGRIGVKSAVDF